jgi:hypothetical protein
MPPRLRPRHPRPAPVNHASSTVGHTAPVLGAPSPMRPRPGSRPRPRHLIPACPKSRFPPPPPLWTPPSPPYPTPTTTPTSCPRSICPAVKVQRSEFDVEVPVLEVSTGYFVGGDHIFGPDPSSQRCSTLGCNRRARTRHSPSLRRSPVSTVPRLPLQAPASVDLASVQTSDASHSPTARTVAVASWGSPAAQHPSGRTTGYTSPCAAPARRAPTSTSAAPWAASPVPPRAPATSPTPRSTPYSRRATRRRGIQLQPQRLLLHGRPQLQFRRVRRVWRRLHRHRRHAAHVELRGRPAHCTGP